MDVKNFKINYITSYKKVYNKKENIVKLNLEKLSYNESDKHFHFIYDGIIIKRDNNYQVSYNCITCNRENIVSLNNLVKKIEKRTKHCFNCINNCKESLVNKIENDADYFHNKLDDKNKRIFKKKMVTEKQFERLRSQLLSFNKEKYDNFNDIIYISYYRPTESLKYYESCLYNKKTDSIFRAVDFKVLCRHCKYCFNIESLKPYRNQKYIYCKMCISKIGSTKFRYESNINGENIAYKTKMQLKFIKYCNNNEIICINGPRDIIIENFPEPIYIDFKVGNYFIDIVGNKEYQEEESEKTKFLRSYIVDGKYIIIYPHNYVKYTRLFKKNESITPLPNHS